MTSKTRNTKEKKTKNVKVEEIGKRMEEYIEESNEMKKKIDELGIKISTMTMVVNLSEKINVKNSENKKIPELFKKYETEYKFPKGKKTGDEFMNQFTIKYKDERGKKNIKVFPNGKLHMTGIKEAKEVKEIAENVIEMMNDGNNKIETVKFCLINSNMHVNMGLNLNKMAILLQKEEESDLTLPFTFHDPNKYPGLRIKYIDATCLIFASGAIMIAGAKSLESIIKTHNYITNFIKMNKNEINCPELLKIKKKSC